MEESGWGRQSLWGARYVSLSAPLYPHTHTHTLKTHTNRHAHANAHKPSLPSNSLHSRDVSVKCWANPRKKNKNKYKQHNETLMSAPTSEGTQLRKSVSRPRSTAEGRKPRAAACVCARVWGVRKLYPRGQRKVKKKKKKREREFAQDKWNARLKKKKLKWFVFILCYWSPVWLHWIDFSYRWYCLIHSWTSVIEYRSMWQQYICAKFTRRIRKNNTSGDSLLRLIAASERAGFSSWSFFFFFFFLAKVHFDVTS